MKIIILGKKHQNQPLFQSIFTEAIERNHTVALLDKRDFLDMNLSNIDLVCLKSHFDVDSIWIKLEEAGVVAINSQAATKPCLDRRRLNSKLNEHNIPIPPSAVAPNELITLRFPVIQKPINAGDHNLMIHRKYVSTLDFEHHIYQELLQSSGIVYKLYVIGEQHFFVQEKDGSSRVNGQLDLTMSEYGRRIQEAFGLTLFGVDFIIADDKHYVIDVNPFPGFRGVMAVGQAFWECVEEFS